MNEQTRLSPEQRTDLVAYLDGELDEERTQAMERLLAESPEARREVDLLTRTFALLDSLPRPGAPAELSTKTLSVVRAELPVPRWLKRTWYRHARRGIVAAAWVVGLLVAAMTGYLTANRLLPSENVRLVRELPVIENLDAYRDVEDIQLLEEFAKHKVFDGNDGATKP